MLSEFSLTKKLRNLGCMHSSLTPWLKLSKFKLEVRRNREKESGVVNWIKVIYFKWTKFKGGDVFN